MNKTMMISVSRLEPHERAMNFWPDSEERENDVAELIASVKAVGCVKRSLLVTPKEDGDGYWVIDGCTRLKAAVAAGIEEVPCEVKAIPFFEIDDEVFVSNMDRTRFGSGMRVMKYLERHANDVLETSIENADPHATGAKGGRGNKAVSSETSFSLDAIMNRLGVSKPDALGGVELLKCRLENKTIVIKDGKRTMVDATDEDRAGVDAAYLGVLTGGSLRRWVPAAKGRSATKGRGKAGTDYAALADKSSISLANALRHWGEADWTGAVSKKKVNQQLVMMLDVLVLCHGIDFFSQAIKTRWPADTVTALVKSLKA